MRYTDADAECVDAFFYDPSAPTSAFTPDWFADGLSGLRVRGGLASLGSRDIRPGDVVVREPNGSVRVMAGDAFLAAYREVPEHDR